MNARSILIGSLFLASLSLSTAGAGAQESEEDLKVLRLYPPAIVLDGVRRVAVLDFSVVGTFPRGTDPGARTAEQLTIALNDEQRIRQGILDEVAGEVGRAFGEIGSRLGGLFGGGDDDEPPPAKPAWARSKVFDVAAGSEVQAAVRAAGVTVQPSLSAEQAQGVRDALGVDALITGTVERLDDGQDAFVRDGNETCYQREVHIRIALSVIDGTATVLAAPPAVESRRSDRKCGNTARQELRAEQELLSAAFEDAEGELSNTIAPVFEETELSLMRVEGPGGDQAEDAAELAKEGDLYQAHGIYLQLSSSDSFNPELAYNLGVLNEVVGNYDEAAERYALAAELAPGVDRYSEGLRRAQTMSGEVGIWQALGLEYQPVEWGAPPGEGLSAGAEAQTLGDREDRHPLFDAPDADAPVDQIPGGISVTVLETAGDWVRIRLPGNRELWIAGANLRVG